MNKLEFSYPRGNFPRLVLAGNSNVGKSSITKLLLSHPQWYKGHIGKNPGSTVRLTIINDPELNYHVIDLPGFGKMLHKGKEQEKYVQEQILHYVEIDRHNIFLLIYIVSAERLGEELEKWYFQNQDTIPLTVDFVQFALTQGIPVLMVLNKIDKINHYKQKDLMVKLKQVLADFKIGSGESTQKNRTVSGKSDPMLTAKGKQGANLERDPDAPLALVDIIQTSVTEKIGVDQVKKIVKAYAARLDLKQFDPRSTLLDLPDIDRVQKNKERAEHLERVGHTEKKEQPAPAEQPVRSKKPMQTERPARAEHSERVKRSARAKNPFHNTQKKGKKHR